LVFAAQKGGKLYQRNCDTAAAVKHGGRKDCENSGQPFRNVSAGGGASPLFVPTGTKALRRSALIAEGNKVPGTRSKSLICVTGGVLIKTTSGCL